MEIRVQNVASQSKYHSPAEFIRSETEQPGITTVQGVNPEVPTIDMSNPDEENLMNEIVAASSQWGMYQIINHRIPSKIIAEFQAVGKAFFKLPQEQKELISNVPGSIEGYGTNLEKDEEGKRNWVDHLFTKHGHHPPLIIASGQKNPPSYRNKIQSQRETDGTFEEVSSVGNGDCDGEACEDLRCQDGSNELWERRPTKLI